MVRMDARWRFQRCQRCFGISIPKPIMHPLPTVFRDFNPETERASPAMLRRGEGETVQKAASDWSWEGEAPAEPCSYEGRTVRREPHPPGVTLFEPSRKARGEAWQGSGVRYRVWTFCGLLLLLVSTLLLDVLLRCFQLALRRFLTHCEDPPSRWDGVSSESDSEMEKTQPALLVVTY